MLSDTVINPFIMTTENDNILFNREGIGYFLVEYFTVGCCIDYLIIVSF